MNYIGDICVMFVIETIDDNANDVSLSIEERLGVHLLATLIMNIDHDGIEEYNEMVSDFYGRGSYTYSLKKIDLDLKNWTTPMARPFIEEPLVLELKAPLSHLHHAFLRADNTLPMIISDDLVETKVEVLILVLLRFKRAIRCTIKDIMSISPGICTHKI